MESGAYVALSGALAMERRLEIISNNIANVNTSGFKAEKMAFEVVVPEGSYSNMPIPQADSNVSPLAANHPFILDATFVDGGTTFIDFSEGPLQKTDNPLHLSLSGDGFFVLETPEGTRYTRSGGFVVSPEGLVTTLEGHSLQGEGGAIALGGGVLNIDSTGNIEENGEAIDVLKIVDFAKPYALRKDENGLYVADENVEEVPVQGSVVMQGYLELSNVSVIKEMVSMIETTRAYESYLKVLQVYDDMEQQSNKDIGSVK